jgi:hypothetical protein
MRTVVFLLLFCCVPTGSKLWAGQGDSQCRVKEVLNRKGWDVPGLSKTITKTSHAHYAPADPDNIFVDILESRVQADSITLVSCGDTSDRLEILTRPVEITEIQRFTSNDRVFGYLVTAVPVGEGKDGKIVHAASEERLYFYDSDGTGKFTLMRYAGEMFFKIIIPGWAKQKRN